MPKSSLLISLVLVGSVSAVHANEDFFTSSYSRCMDGTVSTFDMIECIGSELEYQDGLLNENYKTLMQTLTPNRKESLKKTQRLWVQYRDANCDFYLDPDGGTLARLQASECVLNMTARRANELGGFLVSP
jgi:uncharacterized protein YecT (DUF1311 family)